MRGVDVLLPGNAVIRSSRIEVDDKTRYSYVEPDGETYDISDIVKEEWRDSDATQHDVLEGVISRNKDVIGDKLDRVLNKIKIGKSQRASSPLEYPPGAEGSGSRAPTPGAGRRTSTPIPTASQTTSTTVSRSHSPGPVEGKGTKARAATPPSRPVYGTSSQRQPSIASVMSDFSTYATPQGAVTPSPSPPESTSSKKKVPILPKEDFGISHMMAIIEYKGTLPKTPLPRLHPVDELLYGRTFDVESLHADVRNIYSESFKRLEDMDKVSSCRDQVRRLPC